jgi:hypothetical protein
MKYLLSVNATKNSQLHLENITAARTSHIFGYGAGVTFSSGVLKWNQDSTFYSVRLAGFTNPTVVPQ